MVKLMIVGDDYKLLDQFEIALKNYRKIELVRKTRCEKEAMAVLKHDEIDVLILDIELIQESFNLLSAINDKRINKPFITLVTAIVSRGIFDAARSLGADFVCSKCADDFSPQTILKLIDITSPFLVEQPPEPDFSSNMEAMDGNSQIELNEQVKGKLGQFGFSYKYIGTRYLSDALKIVLTNPGMEISITKNLYPQIAKKYKCNAKVVEKNIRVAIEYAWCRKDGHDKKEIYPYDWNEKTGRPTNLEFIRNVSKHIAPFTM